MILIVVYLDSGNLGTRLTRNRSETEHLINVVCCLHHGMEPFSTDSWLQEPLSNIDLSIDPTLPFLESSADFVGTIEEPISTGQHL